MTAYNTGHVKRNAATGAVAIRTHFADDADFGHMAWLVATPNIGARHATNAEAEPWDDLYTPSSP